MLYKAGVHSVSVIAVVLFCYSVHMVQLPGKRNRRVPMLITPEVVKAMDELVQKREECGIRNNPYFFANSSTGHVDNWQVLKNVCTAAGLSKPHLVTSTNLRKYIATVTQVNRLTAFYFFMYLIIITSVYSL